MDAGGHFWVKINQSKVNITGFKKVECIDCKGVSVIFFTLCTVCKTDSYFYDVYVDAVFFCLFVSLRYKGHKMKGYKLDCCLSGKDTHVLSCSEDGHVYCWDLVEVSVWLHLCSKCI